MTFPEPEEYWSLWPLPALALESWPDDVESASERNRLIAYLARLRDERNFATIDLDPYWAGFWTLNESERRLWMGAFFHHMRRLPLDGLFSTQLFDSFEVPPAFDPRHRAFLQDKKVYQVAERHLILRLLGMGYATVFEGDDWRYREETLAYWAGQ
jgi:hypothetical protein